MGVEDKGTVFRKLGIQTLIFDYIFKIKIINSLKFQVLVKN